MKRLVVLPVSPLGQGGHNIAVRNDLERLGGFTDDDHLVIYQNLGQPNPDGAVLITRPSRLSPRRYLNLLQLKTSTETTSGQLQTAIGERAFDTIFCGEVTFYRGLRKLFPGKRMTVRMHNLYSLARVRRQFCVQPIGILFKANMLLYSRLEQEILLDPLADVILIAETERQYAQLLCPDKEFRIWNPPVDIKQHRPAPKTARIAYLGNIPSHQKSGMMYFVKQIMPAIRARRPELEFHIYGKESMSWNDPENGIFGYGFYESDGIPFDGDALFACPDILGGGIKIKIGKWLEWGVPIIATPFAMDGYDPPKLDNMIVASITTWENRIIEYFDGLDLTASEVLEQKPPSRPTRQRETVNSA